MPMFYPQNRPKIDPSGQAAAEYLLILTVVFLALAGVSVLFSTQVNHYLSLLVEVVVLPF